VAEWFKAPVLKTGVPARVPWVRIPPLPPEPIEVIEEFGFFQVLRTIERTNKKKPASCFQGPAQ
jgi:hypothetical protein